MILQKQLEIGRAYSKEEIEESFDTSFGYRLSGINLRNPEYDPRYIILTSKADGPYKDEVTKNTDEFFYIGEGLPDKGDQTKTYSNKALIDSIDDYLPIFFFVSRDTGEWEYQGLVEVLSYKYINNGERNVFRFKMRKLGITESSEYTETEEKLGKDVEKPPTLTQESVDYEQSRRKVRSTIFSRKIKKLYNYQCAICGAERYSPEGNPEVEAAHIYPKEEEGSDDLRNGFALCKFHHWAFDAGWLSLTDDLRIIVKKEGEVETPKRLLSLEDKKIKTPSEPEFQPHVKFIQGHRELYEF